MAFKQFRVDNGVARIGAGVAVAIDKDQLEPRKPFVQVLKSEGVAAIIRGHTTLEFKRGEVIGLLELPKNLTEVLVPVEEPTTKAEKVAVELAKKRVATKKKTVRSGADPKKAAPKKTAA